MHSSSIDVSEWACFASNRAAKVVLKIPGAKLWSGNQTDTKGSTDSFRKTQERHKLSSLLFLL